MHVQKSIYLFPNQFALIGSQSFQYFSYETSLLLNGLKQFFDLKMWRTHGNNAHLGKKSET